MTPRDEQHLRLLSLFHYLYAGLYGVVGLVAGLALGGVGYGILEGAFPAGSASGPAPPPEVGWVLSVVALVTVLAAGAWALLNAIAGYCLARRLGRTFCFVVAVVDCLNVPVGTVLGACTFMVLGRPTVKAAFEPQPPW